MKKYLLLTVALTVCLSFASAQTEHIVEEEHSESLITGSKTEGSEELVDPINPPIAAQAYCAYWTCATCGRQVSELYFATSQDPYDFIFTRFYSDFKDRCCPMCWTKFRQVAIYDQVDGLNMYYFYVALGDIGW